MPAPVEFTVTCASLPPGFSGDPQAIASATAAALIITPSEPWSSFINGGAQPAANVGPYLKDGSEWLVWSDALGTYTYHTQNGAGLVNATVTLAKMANDTPNTVLTYAADGRPTLISGTAGQIVTAGADGLPAFTTPAPGNYFSLHLSVNQNFESDGTHQQVEFDMTAQAAGITPDLANFRVPVTAGSVWFFGASLQIVPINGAHTDVAHFIQIRPGQSNQLAQGSVYGYSQNQHRTGINTSGIYRFESDSFVDVSYANSCDSTGTNFQVETNGVNTRFYGYRLM